MNLLEILALIYVTTNITYLFFAVYRDIDTIKRNKLHEWFSNERKTLINNAEAERSNTEYFKKRCDELIKNNRNLELKLLEIKPRAKVDEL